MINIYYFCSANTSSDSSHLSTSSPSAPLNIETAPSDSKQQQQQQSVLADSLHLSTSSPSAQLNIETASSDSKQQQQQSSLAVATTSCSDLKISQQQQSVFADSSPLNIETAPSGSKQQQQLHSSLAVAETSCSDLDISKQQQSVLADSSPLNIETASSDSKQQQQQQSVLAVAETSCSDLEISQGSKSSSSLDAKLCDKGFDSATKSLEESAEMDGLTKTGSYVTDIDQQASQPTNVNTHSSLVEMSEKSVVRTNSSQSAVCNKSADSNSDKSASDVNAVMSENPVSYSNKEVSANSDSPVEGKSLKGAASNNMADKSANSQVKDVNKSADSQVKCVIKPAISKERSPNDLNKKSALRNARIPVKSSKSKENAVKSAIANDTGSKIHGSYEVTSRQSPAIATKSATKNSPELPPKSAKISSAESHTGKQVVWNPIEKYNLDAPKPQHNDSILAARLSSQEISTLSTSELALFNSVNHMDKPCLDLSNHPAVTHPDWNQLNRNSPILSKKLSTPICTALNDGKSTNTPTNASTCESGSKTNSKIPKISGKEARVNHTSTVCNNTSPSISVSKVPHAKSSSFTINTKVNDTGSLSTTGVTNVTTNTSLTNEGTRKVDKTENTPHFGSIIVTNTVKVPGTATTQDSNASITKPNARNTSITIVSNTAKLTTATDVLSSIANHVSSIPVTNFTSTASSTGNSSCHSLSTGPVPDVYSTAAPSISRRLESQTDNTQYSVPIVNSILKSQLLCTNTTTTINQLDNMTPVLPVTPLLEDPPSEERKAKKRPRLLIDSKKPKVSEVKKEENSEDCKRMKTELPSYISSSNQTVHATSHSSNRKTMISHTK